MTDLPRRPAEPGATPDRPRNNFDSVAPFYDALAACVFWGNIRRAQLALLPELSTARHALVIGGGTGWFLLALLRRTDVEHVLYIEMSPEMMRRSKDLIAQHAPEAMSRVEFRLGTHASVTDADGPFDLVVTNFFLDLFDDACCLEVARALHVRLAPEGRWLWVDFELPERGLARAFARVLFKVMYTFFKVTSRIGSDRPPDIAPVCAALSLETAVCRYFYAGIIAARILRQAPSAG